MVSLFIFNSRESVIAFTRRYCLSINQNRTALLLMYQGFKNKNIFAFDVKLSEDLLVSNACQNFCKIYKAVLSPPPSPNVENEYLWLLVNVIGIAELLLYILCNLVLPIRYKSNVLLVN